MERTLEPVQLVERDEQLAALTELLSSARDGRGQVALVYGEAGIGKTALSRRFCEDAQGSVRVLWGQCDALFAPRPLGPLVDIARAAGGDLPDVVAAGVTPYEVTLALERRLAAGAPSIVVLEDMHLADEATLDVLRLLGRRVTQLPALIVVTYRDDGFDRWHPLRMVLGEVAAAAPLTRVRLPRLPPDAVAVMAAEHGLVDPSLHRKTGGNPFFVAQVLSSGEEDIPETVRDAVLGRAARLSPPARALIDAVAVTRPRAELWLLRALVPDDIESLEEATGSGILSAGERGVAFRHELAQLAVEQAMPADRREALHRRALELLADPPDGAPDPGRLAHHADAIDDAALVLQYAPLAAAEASRLGAHREAVAHYRRALRFAELAPLEARAGLFAMCAQEAFMIVELEEAVSAQQQALACFDELGDVGMRGAGRAFLAQLLWEYGSLPTALETAKQAVALLEDTPGPELVGACCMMAMLELASEHPPAASQWVERARGVAGDLDDPASEGLIFMFTGWVEYFTGRPEGLEKLERSIELGDEWSASNAYVILVRTACRLRQYGVGERYIRAGLEHCSLGDLDLWRYYLLSWEAKVRLARGDWPGVAEVAQICLANPCPFARIHALVALGLLRARRGDPGAWEPLDEALALAEPRHELQWIAPVAAARAETALLEGRPEAAIAETDATYVFAAGTWWEASLGYWRWRAGAPTSVPDLGEEQYRLELAGDWRGASEQWRAVDCVYEAAFAALPGDDEPSLRRALEQFRELGAAPAAKLATARLREIGARGVPRGPQPRTRENPANLTARELEVLELVAAGLRNADIAERLVISEKTVDHHVSAILRKLGATNRAQAASEAMRLGIAGKNGETSALM